MAFIVRREEIAQKCDKKDRKVTDNPLTDRETDLHFVGWPDSERNSLSKSQFLVLPLPYGQQAIYRSIRLLSKETMRN